MFSYFENSKVHDWLTETLSVHPFEVQTFKRLPTQYWVQSSLKYCYSYSLDYQAKKCSFTKVSIFETEFLSVIKRESGGFMQHYCSPFALSDFDFLFFKSLNDTQVFATTLWLFHLVISSRLSLFTGQNFRNVYKNKKIWP